VLDLLCLVLENYHFQFNIEFLVNFKKTLNLLNILKIMVKKFKICVRHK